ncbi:MAG TPA: UbiA family prenyltransferase [Tepidisphaeraceae bacterium]|jgi:4-hydroxybenzoate polyprenyltransferase|nr:UbiA family prenyltransferase [Tepidisphaeraceae bacterium]
MFELLSQRLLTLLQLSRMALVFTAIADSYATALIIRRVPGFCDAENKHDPLEAALMISIAAVSIGLYGFGMSLNDIADRRRDRQIAAHRPLPSGRVGVFTAHAFMLFLVTGALAAAAYYSWVMGDWKSLLLAVWTAALISFYDLAGKFLVAPGLLALGLIRFFHCLVPGPQVPVLWHPLFLLNHVTILSAVAYQWEEKRPPLTRIHWWTILGGLGAVDGLFVGLLAMRRGWRHIVLIDKPVVTLPLLAPIAAAIVFVGVAAYVRRHARSSREAGQTLMLYGLLWLIVYDAAFVASYAGWLEAVLLVLLFPLAYFSVQLMRWWSKILALSQKPTFKRART